jgi:hypothetical protein
MNDKGYFKLKLIDYFDVWTDNEGGYRVNNLCTLFDDIYTVDLEDRTLLNILKQTGYLKKDIRINQIIFVDEYPFIEIEQRRNNYPLGRFEVLEEGIL